GSTMRLRSRTAVQTGNGAKTQKGAETKPNTRENVPPEIDLKRRFSRDVVDFRPRCSQANQTDFAELSRMGLCRLTPLAAIGKRYSFFRVAEGDSGNSSRLSARKRTLPTAATSFRVCP